jgi:hypothetical protein
VTAGKEATDDPRERRRAGRDRPRRPDVDPADRDHVDSCPVCSEELAELVHVHGLLREEVGMRGAYRVDPGPQVWEQVLAATSEDRSAAPDEVTRPAIAVAPPQHVVVSDNDVPRVDRSDPEPSSVPSLAARRATRS